jgi:hypothetical protein
MTPLSVHKSSQLIVIFTLIQNKIKLTLVSFSRKLNSSKKTPEINCTFLLDTFCVIQ